MNTLSLLATGSRQGYTRAGAPSGRRRLAPSHVGSEPASYARGRTDRRTRCLRRQLCARASCSPISQEFKKLLKLVTGLLIRQDHSRSAQYWSSQSSTLRYLPGSPRAQGQRLVNPVVLALSSGALIAGPHDSGASCQACVDGDSGRTKSSLPVSGNTCPLPFLVSFSHLSAPALLRRICCRPNEVGSWTCGSWKASQTHGQMQISM